MATIFEPFNSCYFDRCNFSEIMSGPDDEVSLRNAVTKSGLYLFCSQQMSKSATGAAHVSAIFGTLAAIRTAAAARDR